MSCFILITIFDHITSLKHHATKFSSPMSYMYLCAIFARLLKIQFEKQTISAISVADYPKLLLEYLSKELKGFF
jgi:hypothetical protein